jgi:hypothetical protein
MRKSMPPWRAIFVDAGLTNAFGAQFIVLRDQILERRSSPLAA